MSEYSVQSTQLSKQWSFTHATYTSQDGDTISRQTFFISTRSQSTQPPPEQVGCCHHPVPDIRLKLKPWYFVDADKHNHQLASEAAKEHLCANNLSSSSEFQRVFLMIKKLAGLPQDSPLKQGIPFPCHGLPNETRTTLESLHNHAENNHVPTKFVGYIASFCALHRPSQSSQSMSNHFLNKEFFTDQIAALDFWQTDGHSREALQVIEQFFT